MRNLTCSGYSSAYFRLVVPRCFSLFLPIFYLFFLIFGLITFFAHVWGPVRPNLFEHFLIRPCSSPKRDYSIWNLVSVTQRLRRPELLPIAVRSTYDRVQVIKTSRRAIFELRDAQRHETGARSSGR